MRTTFTSLYLLALLITFADSLALKHKNGPSGRKSVVVQTPVPRSAWECHPGCKKFCLSSCKRSCCAPGAPNYSPDMFPQLVNYQASLPPPPPPPPACPTGCPSTCYPNCDAGCCFPVNQPPAYPQYPPYTGYDPCVAQSCSSACAPQCNPDCCRSQALNLSIRPVYLGSKASPATAKESPAASRKPEPSPPPPPPPKKKVALNKKPKTGIICVPQCQRLCKPVCIFKCCLPTYKFHDSQPEPKKTVKPHHIKPIASPQRAPVPKLFSQSKSTEARVPDAQQPYADDQQSPYGEPYQNPYQADVSSYMTQQQPAVAMQQQPFPYGAVPQNLIAPYADYQGQPSPGLAPLTCPEPSCSDACAPMCSRSCCAGMAPLLPQPWDKRSVRPHKA